VNSDLQTTQDVDKRRSINHVISAFLLKKKTTSKMLTDLWDGLSLNGHITAKELILKLP
jgi:hypothetical protein